MMPRPDKHDIKNSNKEPIFINKDVVIYEKYRGIINFIALLYLITYWILNKL